MMPSAAKTRRVVAAVPEPLAPIDTRWPRSCSTERMGLASGTTTWR